jgi:uncharacterized protein
MDKTEFEEKFKVLTEHVKYHMESAPGCHDYEHVMRVLHNARILLKEEKEADKNIVELAALLHDIARPEEMESKGGLCHAAHGAKMALPILKECGFHDEKLLKTVSECIRKHRYRGGASPETIEEKIVFDADKLDSIGAVGIGRAFHFAGRFGAKLHNKEEDALASKAYSKEDSAYREYLVKLRNVPERMLTESGKKIAEKRAVFMKEFFEQLNSEVYNGN